MVAEMDPIAEVFPNPLLLPINGIPTYESIAELHIQLKANAASVQSNLGDGQLGLLPLTLPPEVYNTLSAVPFIAPVNPAALRQTSQPAQLPQSHHDSSANSPMTQKASENTPPPATHSSNKLSDASIASTYAP
jgi:hypothetical protein